MKPKIDNILNFAFNKENHLFYWVMYEIQNNEIKIIDALYVPDITENKYCNKEDAPAYNQKAENAFLQYKNKFEEMENSNTETLISIANHLYKNQSNE